MRFASGGEVKQVDRTAIHNMALMSFYTSVTCLRVPLAVLVEAYSLQ